MSAYFWILLCSFAGPLALSFDKKVAYFRQFKFVFIASLIIAIPFIIWDIYFTSKNVWGFTPEYLSGFYLYNLPIEECLFFFIVPFACLFIHQVLKAYFPNFNGQQFTRVFAFYFIFSGILLALINWQNWYTFSATLLAALLCLLFYFQLKVKWFHRFAFTYVVALIPFLIVNGILTGAITEKPIVWYHENHIIGWRIFTIPFEDLYYNLDLLLPICAIFEYLYSRKSTN